MMDSAQILANMQASFPHIYDVYNEKSILYALLSVYADRCGRRNQILTRLYGMIGIDTTYDEDLERRWGSLLGISRNNNESIEDYRTRLMIVYASLAGGTEEAIKYAIASTIGFSDSPDTINKYIKVYDAWLYNGIDESIVNKEYGAFVCTVDISDSENVAMYYDKIMHAINTTKASGTVPYLIFLYTMCDNVQITAEDTDIMEICELSEELGRIAITCDNKFVDTIQQSTQEVGSISSIVPSYSFTGTNIPYITLNNEFVTNMQTDITDACVDKIFIDGESTPYIVYN